MTKERGTMRKLLALFALVVTAVLTVGTTQASANISALRWANGTIYIDNISGSDSWVQYENNRVAYLVSLHDTQGVNWAIVNGPCHVNYPCIHVLNGYWGTTIGWLGLTTYGNECSANVLCGWNGSAAENPDHTASTWTLVEINKSYALNPQGVEAAACHEFGHAVPQLQHASGTTCMQAGVSDTSAITYQPSEVTEIKNKFASIPR